MLGHEPSPSIPSRCATIAVHARKRCAAWLAGAALLSLPWAALAQAPATTAPNHEVEFVVWSRTYSGSVGNKAVSLTLQRAGNALQGTYCYQPCSDKTHNQLILQGTSRDAQATLDEHDGQATRKPPPVTGAWHLDSLEHSVMNGTWSSADGKKTQPVTLTEQTPGKPFPFEIRMVADHLPQLDAGACPDAPHISALRLYQNGRRVQTLAADSQGTCGIFFPEIVDANFDGWPDLMLAQALPAGPNIPYQTWLFDPASRRMVDAPTAFQEIPAPNFDQERKLVWSDWRDGCCDHGVDVYRWNGKQLSKIAAGESYTMPVSSSGKLRFCYVMPEYLDGHVVYPDALWETHGKLTLDAKQAAQCDTEPPGQLADARLQVDAWHREPAGAAPTRIRHEVMTWQRVMLASRPMYCPNLPLFERGEIRRVTWRDPNDCEVSDPSKK